MNIIDRTPICPESCNGNGVCDNGVCQCHGSWSGPSCTINGALLTFNVLSFHFCRNGSNWCWWQ